MRSFLSSSLLLSSRLTTQSLSLTRSSLVSSVSCRSISTSLVLRKPLGTPSIHLFDSVTKTKLPIENTLPPPPSPSSPSSSPSLLQPNSLPNTLSWYSCGPTVYDVAHLGHGRAYVSIDILVRCLQMFGINVWHVMGVTDIDDKIINRSKQEGISPQEVAEKYEKSFFSSMEKLNVASPTLLVRVTQHIPSIISLIEKIMENGYAYEANGSVYFDLEKYDKERGYSALVPKQEKEEPQEETREEKKSHKDFALWKAFRGPTDTNIGWKSPWGHGVPGWHIECSSMIKHIFGDHLGVHGGGIDLSFPHHANEIAQTLASLPFIGEEEGKREGEGTVEKFGEEGKKKRWPEAFVHVGHLEINGKKMAKSLKNFTSVDDFLEGGKTGEGVEGGLAGTAVEFRMFCLLNHYRKNVEISQGKMKFARKTCSVFSSFLKNARVQLASDEKSSEKWEENERDNFVFLEKKKQEILESIADDFNTPHAIDLLKEVVKFAEQGPKDSEPSSGRMRVSHLNNHQLSMVVDLVSHFLGHFGINLHDLKNFPHHPKNEESPSSSPNKTLIRGEEEDLGGDEVKRLSALMDILTKYRFDVRSFMLNKELSEKERKQKIFEAGDKVRDEVLESAGVRIRDTHEGSHWVFEKEK